MTSPDGACVVTPSPARVLPAPVSGVVIGVEVTAGQAVAAEVVLVLLESMKMEMPVEADQSGRVDKIHCSEGQAVNEGDVLLTIA